MAFSVESLVGIKIMEINKMFRADDVRGKEVKGCYAKINGEHLIIRTDARLVNPCSVIAIDPCPVYYIKGYAEIDPTTLAMQTGILDKHKVEIYGSYPVDGIKSEGGDRVKLSYGIPPTYDILKIEYVNNEETMDMFVSGWWMRNERENGVSTSLCKTYENDLEIIGE